MDDRDSRTGRSFRIHCDRDAGALATRQYSDRVLPRERPELANGPEPYILAASTDPNASFSTQAFPLVRRRPQPPAIRGHSGGSRISAMRTSTAPRGRDIRETCPPAQQCRWTCTG